MLSDEDDYINIINISLNSDIIFSFFCIVEDVADYLFCHNILISDKYIFFSVAEDCI